ncbi:MAG: ribulose-phosphate 3-epimerase [Candidatus Fluviicola riflensis]|nr:MAG: ribulose-phosphate 3-epimerase [Candidatus Fluviicola riflensis]OGS79616.1 MAG: ribulose-phosphate 3-epimerase [Candidatus Fluviicola riflensis]OGS87047.1 MAG: ribulose-phosphate 3-epimerase [Fluviicola sp. RIFCSPHIGHO2_01_FULL_43_53]OGS89839.1 MAG: ribulose-phosphate 3-epimerase [Fluviicola sp. RIFCSPHIGHO2_12_FULL_43_24]
MSVIIAPSILSCDFGNLERDFQLINRSQADWFHVDVMDGVFVPNISFGFPIIEALKKVAEKPLDVHIMISNPDKYIGQFAKSGADILTVHYEVCPHLHRTIAGIKETGMKAGVALNPHTPVSVLENVIADLDLVLIMSVNPGFGGQTFIRQAIEKVRQVKAMIQKTGSSALIEVDGGVNTTTGAELVAAGADALVAGSFVFNNPDPTAVIASLKAL